MDDWKSLVEKIRNTGYCNEAVEKAMLETPRATFVLKEFEEYANYDQPLPIGEGQTTSQPSIIAYILTKLDLKEGMNVLEVGTGCGYVSALLSKLVNNGKVTTVEINQKLLDFAKGRLASYKNIDFILGDGSAGFEKNAPYDRIILLSATPSMPEALFQQLKDEGKMMMPLGSALYQELVEIKKIGGKPDLTHLMPVVFVPMVKP